MTPRVLVAMSGGVDSSVAAALLVEAGHDVVGATLKLWGGDGDRGCCTVADVDDARSVARTLGIEHHVFNLGDDFTRHVVEPYVAAHAAGRTPNPCIECNRHLKFDRLLRRAVALGFDRLATGHHARVVERADGTRRVARGADRAKDQSYVLHPLDAEGLARIDFPVGHLTKDGVRAEAARLGLRTAAKPDSQDVCFVTSAEGRAGFLADRLRPTPGRVVDTAGAEVGTVPAVELVTVGQRRGLGLPGGTEPRYVVAVDVAAATVTVGSAAQARTDRIEVTDLTWVGDAWPAAGGGGAAGVGGAWSEGEVGDGTRAGGEASGPLDAQCSAHGRPLPCRVEPSPAGDGGGRATVVLDQPARRVAPGQSVVLYQDDQVVAAAVAR